MGCNGKAWHLVARAENLGERGVLQELSELNKALEAKG